MTRAALCDDDQQTRSVCYVMTFVDGLVRVLLSADPDLIARGSPTEGTIRDLMATGGGTPGPTSPMTNYPLATDDPPGAGLAWVAADRRSGGRLHQTLAYLRKPERTAD